MDLGAAVKLANVAQDEAEATTRYVVEWYDWKATKVEAIKRAAEAGVHLFEENSTGEVTDFVDTDEFKINSAFFTFDKAVDWAKQVAPLDTWRCPRIYRQHREDRRDDLGMWTEWEPDLWWEVFADDPAPAEADGMDYYS